MIGRTREVSPSNDTGSQNPYVLQPLGHFLLEVLHTSQTEYVQVVHVNQIHWGDRFTIYTDTGSLPSKLKLKYIYI